MWRIFQLNKHLSKSGHVWSKFGSGNRQSLSKAGKDLKARGRLNGTVISNMSTPLASLGPTPLPSRGASPAPSDISSMSTSSESDPDGGTVGRETRRRLVEWWSKEYCASRMKLCVIGKGAVPSCCLNMKVTKPRKLATLEPLNELSDLVSNLFTPIKNRSQDPLPTINEHPFGPNETSVCNNHILPCIPHHLPFLFIATCLCPNYYEVPRRRNIFPS
jgi:insulysin